MKKYIALLLTVLMICVTLVGCGGKERLNYKKGLKDNVELYDYTKIVIDRNSADYLKLANEIVKSELQNYPKEIKEGTVENGDIANINYAGKVDGVAFSGGTSEGYDLTIGSNTFIEGFEEQLIGVKVGQTVDVNVTFPEGYNDSTDLATGSVPIKLAGKKAVFTVKVNYINRPYTEISDEFAVAAGYENKAKYLEDLEDRTSKQYIIEFLRENSFVNSVPEDKEGNSYNYHKNYYTTLAQQYYGITFEEFLTSNQLTESAFKLEILTDELIMYACFDKLGLEVSKDSVAKKTEELAKLNEASNEEIISYFTENYIECIYVKEMVVNELIKIVEVKGDHLSDDSIAKE